VAELGEGGAPVAGAGVVGRGETDSTLVHLEVVALRR
jgi:hypothetical protein